MAGTPILVLIIMKINAAILALLVSMLWGCAYKNYSKQKPDASDLVGTWILREKSRQSVETACGCKLTDNDGILIIRSDGSIVAKGVPGSPDFKIALFGGTGTWNFVQRGQIWEMELQIKDTASSKIIHVVLDVGHDDGKVYLNQAIDDPDGEVMYFDRAG
jgi:hypothetical protein